MALNPALLKAALSRVAGALDTAAPVVAEEFEAPIMGALGPRMKAPRIAKPILDDEGRPIQGPAYNRAAKEALAEIEAEGKGAGPLDMSTQDIVPNVPQTPLERHIPRRGVSPRLQDALARSDVIQGIDDSIETGIGMGAHKWYHTEPVRLPFIEDLGEKEGPTAFKQYAGMVAATSPRSKVPENIRNASFYYQMLRNNMELPEKLAYPYGHIAQNTHRSNFEGLTRSHDLSAGTTGALGEWNVLQNPKPASFTENLIGNLEPGTMDTHAFRNIGMRTGDPRFLETQIQEPVKKGRVIDPESVMGRFAEIKDTPRGKFAVYRPQKLHAAGKLSIDEAKTIPAFWTAQPNDNEYAAAEQLYKRLGSARGLPTAGAQSAAWSGGGELTGLGTVPDKTFSEMFNERILFTAKIRKENPRDTLRDFIRGKKPLLSLAGMTALGGGAMGWDGMEDEPAGGAGA